MKSKTSVGRKRADALRMLAGCLVMGLGVWSGGECTSSNQTVQQQPPGRPGAKDEKRGSVEKYHIVVARPSGRMHRQAAEALKTDIGKAKGVVVIDGKNVNAEIDPLKLSVVHDEDRQQSTIYYGVYSGWQVLDAAGRSKLEFEPTAYSDLQLIKQLKIRDPATGVLQPLCPDAFREKISEPDPPCDPAWLIQNAPPGVAYSLQIGFYHSSPLRKQAAIEAVQKLRAEGVPAYLYHGVERSLVMVGEFGPQAVVEVGGGQKPKLSKEVQSFISRHGDAYKYNLDNGQIWYRNITDPLTGKTNRVAQLSFLVRVPRQGEDLK